MPEMVTLLFSISKSELLTPPTSEVVIPLLPGLPMIVRSPAFWI